MRFVGSPQMGPHSTDLFDYVMTCGWATNVFVMKESQTSSFSFRPEELKPAPEGPIVSQINYTAPMFRFHPTPIWHEDMNPFYQACLLATLRPGVDVVPEPNYMPRFVNVLDIPVDRSHLPEWRETPTTSMFYAASGDPCGNAEGLMRLRFLASTIEVRYDKLVSTIPRMLQKNDPHWDRIRAFAAQLFGDVAVRKSPGMFHDGLSYITEWYKTLEASPLSQTASDPLPALTGYAKDYAEVAALLPCYLRRRCHWDDNAIEEM